MYIHLLQKNVVNAKFNLEKFEALLTYYHQDRPVLVS